MLTPISATMAWSDGLTDPGHRLQPGRRLGDGRHALSHGGIHPLQDFLLVDRHPTLHQLLRADR